MGLDASPCLSPLLERKDQRSRKTLPIVLCSRNICREFAQPEKVDEELALANRRALLLERRTNEDGLLFSRVSPPPCVVHRCVDHVESLSIHGFRFRVSRKQAGRREGERKRGEEV